MSEDKRGYTTAEAATYMGVSQSFLRQLKRDHKIVARRAGETDRSSLIWFKEDLDDYLDSLEAAK